MNGKQYFTTDDATYAYEITGSGHPVVLLHGFTGSRSTWDTFVQTWQHHYTCIVIDLPGHGETTVHTPRSMKECCEDLAAFLTHLDLPAIHLVGYSMGGRIALSFAMFYPELLLSLTLESSSPGLTSEDEQIARRKQDERLANMIEAKGMKAFVHYWENIPLFSTQKNLPEHVQLKIQKERLSQSAPGLANSLRWMGTGVQPSWWEELPKFTIPTLLIVGSSDQKFVKINKMMKRQFENAHLEIIHNAGHAVHIEHPEKFNQLVGNFLQDLSS